MDNEQKNVIVNLPLTELEPFPNHPFAVRMDDQMVQLVESVERVGVLSPAIVREVNGKYQLVAGHRRKKACELKGKQEMPCIIRNLTDEEATILMVETNIQREEILPSEKAKAYKMRLDAMNKQGKRNDLISGGTSTPLVSRLRSNEELGESYGESREQIRRYIRLNDLIPEILKMVDDKRIAFRPAVELSYLKPEEQKALHELMEYLDVTPSLSQAIQMKLQSKVGELSRESIHQMLLQQKPNQKDKPFIRDEKIMSIIPKSIPQDQQRDYVYQALRYYNHYREQQKKKKLSRDAR